MDIESAHVINFVTALHESNDRFVELGEIFFQLGYDCKLSLDIGGSFFTIIEPARTRELLAIAFYNLDVDARKEPTGGQPVSGKRGSLRSTRFLPSGVKAP